MESPKASLPTAPGSLVDTGLDLTPPYSRHTSMPCTGNAETGGMEADNSPSPRQHTRKSTSVSNSDRFVSAQQNWDQQRPAETPTPAPSRSLPPATPVSNSTGSTFRGGALGRMLNRIATTCSLKSSSRGQLLHSNAVGGNSAGGEGSTTMSSVRSVGSPPPLTPPATLAQALPVASAWLPPAPAHATGKIAMSGTSTMSLHHKGKKESFNDLFSPTNSGGATTPGSVVLSNLSPCSAIGTPVSDDASGYTHQPYPSVAAAAMARVGKSQESSIPSFPPEPTGPKTAIQKVKDALCRRHLNFTDFTIQSTVGTGSFGRVCVVDLAGSTDEYPALALKMLNKAKIIKMKQVEHVKDEKRILWSVTHPFIVNLLAYFQDEHRIFMLMEYVNGGELFSFLRKRGSVPEEGGRFYAAEVVLAFEYLHAKTIVYRDLKPENLLIDNEGHIKITDFGFAKVVETRTFTLCGTHEYLAPETIMRRGHGIPVDWWALGILMYEMITGHPPFYDETPMGIYRKILVCRYDFPPTVSKEARSLIKRLLTPDPSRRYGCLRDGPEDIKNHKFFKPVDWELCFRRGLTAPWKPNVTGPKDTSLFDVYPESTEASQPPITAQQQAEIFADF
eukprot:GHVT01075686.1.p1 GENE.GHVT01075686.1~~GHVT01075686.1.p1  ORF type:complete len:618 (-),score=83.89 GHVT01075686.1:1797-3650(-)